MIKKSDFRVYDLENYDIDSFELGGGHKCRGTDLASHLKLHSMIDKNRKSEEIGLNANKMFQHCALNQTNIKFKLHSRIGSINLIWARDSNCL